MKSILFAVLITSSLALPKGVGATEIVVDGFSTSFDCGAGLQTVQGFHSAVLNLVNPEHENQTWGLNGAVWRCGGFFPVRLTSPCNRSGNTSTTFFLTCETQTDYPCDKLPRGHRSREIAATPGAEDSHESSCYVPHCASAPLKSWALDTGSPSSSGEERQEKPLVE